MIERTRVPSAGQRDAQPRAALSKVRRVLETSGRPLDPITQAAMKTRLGHDFSRVRIHADALAAESARAVEALAYTVGDHIVFAASQYDPGTGRGSDLLTHELVHTLQQPALRSTRAHSAAEGRGFDGLALSTPVSPSERSAAAASGLTRTTGARSGAGSSVGLHIARQQASPAKSPADENARESATDTLAGTEVTAIIVSLARKRVGFKTPLGMILGTVDTDLRPGPYELKPDLAAKKWIIVAPGVKSGLRFTVVLEGAIPWTLRYPDKLPLIVARGLTKEPKTFGEMLGPDNQLIDPLWMYENMPPELRPRAITGPDDFESAIYDMNYRSDRGNLSTWLRVMYRDNSVRDINVSTISQKTPRLWAARQEAYRIMDDYNALFILGSFPAVFFVITMMPVGSAAEGGGFKAVRRPVARAGSGVGGEVKPNIEAGEGTGAAPRAEVGPKVEVGPKAEVAPKVEVAPKTEVAPKPGAGAAAPLQRPVNGKINVGGGLETGSESATNLNPIKPGSGGPSKGIPNHVKASFEEIGDVFEPGSAKEIYSNRLRYNDVTDWPAAARGSARVMAPGGRLSLNVWTQSAEEAQAVVSAFTNAGFKGVKAIGSGTGTLITGSF